VRVGALEKNPIGDGFSIGGKTQLEIIFLNRNPIGDKNPIGDEIQLEVISSPSWGGRRRSEGKVNWRWNYVLLEGGGRSKATGGGWLDKETLIGVKLLVQINKNLIGGKSDD